MLTQREINARGLFFLGGAYITGFLMVVVEPIFSAGSMPQKEIKYQPENQQAEQYAYCDTKQKASDPRKNIDPKNLPR